MVKNKVYSVIDKGAKMKGVLELEEKSLGAFICSH